MGKCTKVIKIDFVQVIAYNMINKRKVIKSQWCKFIETKCSVGIYISSITIIIEGGGIVWENGNVFSCLYDKCHICLGL